MTDSEALRNIIAESGLKYKFIASNLNISPYGLQKKIDNITEFKAREILMMQRILNLSNCIRDKIFFAPDSD